MKPLRLIVISLIAALAVFGSQRFAMAAPTSCFFPGTVQQGQSFTVSGDGDTNSEFFRVLLDGGPQVIGQGFTNASGTPITYAISATMPSTAAAPGSHTISIQHSGGTFFCGSIFVTAAAAPTPTPPVPTPTPVTTPTPTTAPVVVVTFPPFPQFVLQQQQQQQQQQAGGGGGAPQRQGDPARAAAGGQQQQQQQAGGGGGGGGGGILPRTGVDIGKTAAWGGGLLAFGLLLVMFARRRRRIARRRALAELPPIDAVVIESDEPWMRGTAHPSEFLTEADGVPPVYLPEVEQLYLPAPEADVDADDDVLTPSF